MTEQREPGDHDGPDHLEVAPPSPDAARRLVLVTAALLASALVVVVALTRTGDGPAPAPTPAVSTPGRSTPGPTGRPDPAPTPTDGSAAPGDPVDGRLESPPWPGAGAGWELFGQDSRNLYRVRLSTGEVTRTPVRIASAPGARSTFVAGPDGVLVQSTESSAGVFVPDGAAAVPVELGRGGDVLDEVLPGPRGRVWVVEWDPASPSATARQRDLSGADPGPGLAVAGSRPFGGVLPDGSGGLLVQGVGGTWQLGQVPRRVTRGAVLATGPRTHVYLDCDEVMVCSRFVRDVGTDRTRRIGPAGEGEGLLPTQPTGLTSPDGRRAVLWRPAEPALDVVDLATGQVATRVSLGGGVGADLTNTAVWSPDSRNLLVLTDDGVSRVDVITGERSELALGSFGPGLRRLTLRS